MPRRVKHGDDAWDAQNKILRHVEDHLHRHLLHVMELLKEFSGKNRYSAIIVGGHKPSSQKSKTHPIPLQ